MTRLTGLNPLAYLGVEATSPGNIREVQRNPGPNDIQNFFVGDQVIVRTNGTLWELIAINNNLATWVQLYPAVGSVGIGTLAGDSGTATGGTVTIAGGSNIGTSAAGSTVTVNLDNTVTISGDFTSTAGNISAAFSVNGTNITATGGDISDINGNFFAHNDTNTSAVGTFNFIKSRGGPAQTNDFLGVLSFQGFDSGGFISSLGAAITSQITGVVGAGSVPSNLSFSTHNTGDPSGTTVERLRINANGSIVVKDFVGFAGVVQSDVTGLLSSTKGTDGQLLISSSTVFPAWATLTAGAGVTITNASNSITIAASGGGGGITTLTGDSGSATGASVQIAGGSNLTTVAAGAVVTVNLDNNVLITGTFEAGTEIATTNGAIVGRNTDVDAQPALLGLEKSRGGAIVQPGDGLGAIIFFGSDGVGQQPAAVIGVGATGTPGLGSVPGKIVFLTKPDSVNPLTQRMNIDEDGVVTINAPDSGPGLIVLGGGIDITGQVFFDPALGEGVLQTSNTGQVTGTNGIDGQILIAAAGGTPSWSAISPGAGITVTNAANSITISATGAFTWDEFLFTNLTIGVNEGWFIANGDVVQVNITLPPVHFLGDVVKIISENNLGWVINLAGGSSIIYGNTSTSVNGTFTSSSAGDAIELVSRGGADWFVQSSIGNFTLT